MGRILYFMTRKGLINTGVLSVGADQHLLPKDYHNVGNTPAITPPPVMIKVDIPLLIALVNVALSP